MGTICRVRLADQFNMKESVREADPTREFTRARADQKYFPDLPDPPNVLDLFLVRHNEAARRKKS